MNEGQAQKNSSAEDDYILINNGRLGHVLCYLWIVHTMYTCRLHTHMESLCEDWVFRSPTLTYHISCKWRLKGSPRFLLYYVFIIILFLNYSGGEPKPIVTDRCQRWTKLHQLTQSNNRTLPFHFHGINASDIFKVPLEFYTAYAVIRDLTSTSKHSRITSYTTRADVLNQGWSVNLR